MLSQLLCDCKNDICSGGANRNSPNELETDHLWDQHRNWLAQHCCLSLNATYSPTQDAEPIDHGRVRVGSNTRVWIRLKFAIYFARHDGSSKVFDVYLVHDSGAGRNNFEVIKRCLAPAKELVALAVSLVLEFNISLKRFWRSGDVDYDGVVNDHLGRS